MIDRRVYIINGWAVTGREQVRKMKKELYEIDAYYFDDVQEYFVYDSCEAEYIYFGGVLSSFDADYDTCHVVINEKLLYDADEKYKKFLEKYPKYAEVFKKYTNNEPPQVIVALHIW